MYLPEGLENTPFKKQTCTKDKNAFSETKWPHSVSMYYNDIQIKTETDVI